MLEVLNLLKLFYWRFFLCVFGLFLAQSMTESELNSNSSSLEFSPTS